MSWQAVRKGKKRRRKENIKGRKRRERKKRRTERRSAQWHGMIVNRQQGMVVRLRNAVRWMG